MCGRVRWVVGGAATFVGCLWQCEHGGRNGGASISVASWVLVMSIVRGRSGLVVLAPTILRGAILFVGGQLAPPIGLLKSALFLGPVIVFRLCLVCLGLLGISFRSVGFSVLLVLRWLPCLMSVL